MDGPDFSERMMRIHLLTRQGEDEWQLPGACWAELAAAIGKNAEDSFLKELTLAFENRRLLLSLPLMQFLLGRPVGQPLVSTPLSEVAGRQLPAVSVADSELLRFLENEDAFVAEVPLSFLQAMQRSETWQIHYREALNTAVEVSAKTLWEGMARRMLATGYPLLRFPGAVDPVEKLGFPGGPSVRGALNLAAHLREEKGAVFLDWDGMRSSLELLVSSLDRVLDVLPEEELAGDVLEYRRLGIGLVGWAEVLVRLRIPYGQPESISLARRVAKYVQQCGQEASAALVSERGSAGLEMDLGRGKMVPVRNQVRLQVLPDEELALLMGTTPGIEPLPGLAGRWKMSGEEAGEVWFFQPALAHLEANGWLDEEVLNELMDQGCLSEELELPLDVSDLFRVRSQIGAAQQLEQQIAFQQFARGWVGQRIWWPEETAWEPVGDLMNTALRTRGRGLWVVPERFSRFGLGI